MKKSQILAVPTSIITGFLGVGKTSAILQLLRQKPADERWAVLVNEFGEIGIDKSLYEGQLNKDSGVFIREVRGGCMCCAASLPMQIALNQLLAESRPHRLIIEPTGLGHPKEVMQVLTAEHYQSVLAIQKTITLVDARKLNDERYTSHETFNQQIAIADVVVGNKQDLYTDEDKERLRQYVDSHCNNGTKIIFAENGQLSLENLIGPASNYVKPGCHHHLHTHHTDKSAESYTAEPALQTGDIVFAQNSGEGFNSAGWRFAPDIIFNYHQLRQLITGIKAERLKGVFITDAGVYGYNLTPDGLVEVAMDDGIESRVEIIAREIPEDLKMHLTRCFS